MRKITFGFLAVFFLFVAAMWRSQVATFVALPLDAPIDLSQRGQKTFTFTAREDGRHFVQVNLRSDSLANFKRPEVRVFLNNNEIRYGSYTGAIMGETANAVLRDFVAIKESTYKIVVDVTQPHKQIQATQPRLQVRVFQNPILYGMNSIMLKQIGAFLCLLLGLGFLLASLVNRTVRSSTR